MPKRAHETTRDDTRDGPNAAKWQRAFLRRCVALLLLDPESLIN